MVSNTWRMWARGACLAVAAAMRPFASFMCVLGLDLVLGGVSACADPVDEASSPSEGAITSTAGTPLELRFSTSVIGWADDRPRYPIASQLQYMQGLFTSAVGGNAMTGTPTLSIIEETIEGDRKTIRYDAVLNVVWPKGAKVPKTYELVLPKDVTALRAFDETYDGTCGRKVYGYGTFWHDFNPSARSCQVNEADVVRATATVAVHPQTTEGKYPEYDQVWADDTLDVVAVFGAIASTQPTDEGARMREQLLAVAKASLHDAVRTDAPPMDLVVADSTVSGTIALGGVERKVNVTGIFLKSIAITSAAFKQRFTELTANADVIIYEGHSELGESINAFGRGLGATAGKYQLVYLYGCQTLAYLEPDMHDKRVELNGPARDPEGTKFLDVIATALPAYGDNGRSSIGLYMAMLDMGSPKTFEDLIRDISPRHLTTVYGEHDNTFQP